MKRATVLMLFAPAALGLEFAPGEKPPLGQLEKVLLSGSLRGRELAARKLAEDGSPGAVRALLKGLADDHACYFCVDGLRGIASPKLTDLLAEGLSMKHFRQRMFAAHVLGLGGDERASAPLAKALSDPNHNVRIFAAEALREVGNEVARGALVRALKDDHPLVRVNAAAALGKVGGEEAVKALIAALEDEWASVNAAKALGTLADPAAEEALLRAARSDEMRAASAAVVALGGFSKSVRAADELDELSRASSLPRIRAEAGDAAQAIRGRAGR